MLNKLSAYLRLVMFSHTLFSLPFAVCALLLIRPNWELAALVCLALISARTIANAINRIVDLRLDIKNHRTADRPLCIGEISLKDTYIFTVATAVVLLLSTALIDISLIVFLPFIGLAFVFYAFTKRFTAACHFILGFICSLSVVGVCIACKVAVFWRLTAACALSVTGFDIIYSIEDIEFDRAFGLHSIPVLFGKREAVLSAAVCLLLSCYFSGTFLKVAGLISYLISILTVVFAFMGNYKLAAYRMNRIAGVIRLLVFGINYIKI